MLETNCVPEGTNYVKDICIPLMSALIGAGVGGWIAYWVSKKSLEQAHANTLELKSNDHDELIRGFLLGISTEIHSLLTTYENEFLEVIQEFQPGMSFDYHWPVTQNYFIVYEQGAHLIGQVPDDELRRLIIQIYLLAMGIIDTHRHNNELLDRRNLLNREAIVIGQNDPAIVGRREAINQELVEYGPYIQSNYNTILQLVHTFDARLAETLPSLQA